MAYVKANLRNLADVLRGEVANRLVGDLRERFEKNIIASIPAEIKDDPPIHVDVTYSLTPSDGLMKFDVKAASETVTGIKEVEVSASSTSSAHTRVLDGQRNFKTKSGFVTGNKIPEALLDDIVKHGVMATMSPSEHGGHSLDEHTRSGF